MLHLSLDQVEAKFHWMQVTSVASLSAVFINFTKMNGAGNDFVVIDNRSQKVALSPAQIVRICDRHRGVGADGVILFKECSTGKADWAWDFYNSDGSSAEMCGNGSRCFARYIQRSTGSNGGITFETRAGVIAAKVNGELATIRLTSPRDIRLRDQIQLSSGKAEVHSVDTGVPHAILFVPDADLAMVQLVGHEVRFHPHFAPRGTNVNFVQLRGNNCIRVRTYERGVEGETLACGTGVTASALVSALIHGYTSPVKVQVQSGDTLEISFKLNGNEFSEVGLTGPADFVYEGRIEL